MEENFSLRSIAKSISNAESKVKKDLANVATKSKKTLKDAAASVKAEGKKVNKAIKKTISKVKLGADEIMFAELLPLKPVMINALNAKKVKHTGKLNDVAPKFLKYIVENKPVGNNFDDFSGKQLNKLNGGFKGTGTVVDYYDADEIISDGGKGAALGATVGSVVPGAGTAVGAGVGAVAGATGGIIKKIIAWFKARKAKKEAKKAAELAGKTGSEADNAGDPNTPPLTAEEQKILDDADNAADTVVDAATDDVQKQEASFFGKFSITEIVIALAVATGVIGFIIYLSKGKK